MVQYNTRQNKYVNNNDEIYEVFMTAGGVSGYTSKGNLNTGADAFGRQRTSHPHTLFDSSFRYRDSEDRWNTKLVGGASYDLDVDAGVINMNVGTSSGDEVIRETDRVFGYQPGKSLLTLCTFTMAPAQTNLRQRVGYFGKQNGIFIELDDDTLYIVKRSYSSGSIVETRVAQQDWNINKLLKEEPHRILLDITKSQIFWSDIEWLGVGSVRAGFVINGQFVPCHIFHHANNITATYMTTASLPVRYEITNTGITASPTTMKQICSSVISEGGYTLQGLTQSASNPIVGKNLTNNINNPMVTIRLRSGKTDAIVQPKQINFYGIQDTPFKYKIIRGGTLTGASWQFVDSDYSVEYDLAATTITGGTVIYEGLFKGQSNVDTIHLNSLFGQSVQLTRGIIEADSAGEIFCVAITPTTNNDDAVVSLNWQNHNA